jgi:cytochrome c553
MRLSVCGLVAASCLAVAGVTWGDDSADHAFFESKVRPLLLAKCIECHGNEKPKAGLRLDSLDAVLTGGESGPAAVSGKPEESLLIDVISYRNTVQMPPKSKLPDAEIAALTEWVRRGLPWPNSKPTVPATGPATPTPVEFSDEQKSFWAFQPVQRTAPPDVKSEHWIRTPIDRFILAELETRDLTVSREADRRTLIRRVTLDLIGLPPTTDEVADFLADGSEDALEKLVDRLLASPRYGERWARHWLDIARYADSNGLDENLAYANAYRYRDYVVRAMRDDKPYDRFLMEQIAGDLLPSAEPGHSARDTASGTSSFDPLIATGFLSLGAKMLAEDDPVKMQMDIIDEQVDTIARAVMGLTMGCARCHDHKFDPLTTEDYYGLAGIFKSTQTMDTFTVVARWHERPLATASQLKDRDDLRQLATTQKQAIEKLKDDATSVILAEARQHVGNYLLAATQQWKLAEKLSHAKPRGNEANPASLPGAILIEAEDYARGNVLKDRDNYGKEIGVLVNRGEAPNFTEYDIRVDQGGTYQFELRYAAAATRPVRVSLNGKTVKSDAAAKLTGSWTPESQTWFVECFVTLTAGPNVIRLEQPQFFPHIDKLLLTPIKSDDRPSDVLLAQNDSTNSQSPRLIPSIVQQWTKVLEGSKSESKSILAAWHQFVQAGQLNADSLAAESGISRLLAGQQPVSLQELAVRYDRLFADAESAWKELKASEQGKEAKSLSDQDLEAARSLLTDPKGPLAIPPDLETEFSAETVAQLKAGREELARREAAVPRFPEAMAVSDSKPENLKIHLRGSHLTLGREVPRQLPRILSGNHRTAIDASLDSARPAGAFRPEGSGRLQLAEWLASPEHPLTSRVMVNRIWQWHFGQGLVRSPDNFGRLGERPSHPRLLDWLAREFASRSVGPEHDPHAWSLKRMHRLMLASSAYRQRTDANSVAALADPENRLLWRFHRQRMDAEVLRDSLLALSGQLDETPGGTLLTSGNREYVTSTANVNPMIYNSNRRSIYLPVVRSALFEVFTAFDFADPSTLAGQRDQTTVAPQALFMMNSEFVLNQVRAVASQLLVQSELTAPAKLKSLYNRVYSRDPSEGEVSRGLAYLDRIRTMLTQADATATDVESRAWVSLCRAVVSANEFVYVE